MIVLVLLLMLHLKDLKEDLEVEQAEDLEEVWVMEEVMAWDMPE
jgi:hypothetical protein